MPRMRTCVKCGVEKLAIEVAWVDARKHVKGVCFECMSPEDAEREMARKERLLEYTKAYKKANREKICERKKTYYEANREKERERTKAWQEANREKHRASSKAWHEANREKACERMKAWREANREKMLALCKAYKEANREKVREYGRRNTRDLKDSYIARSLRLPVKAVPEEIIELKRVQLQITREIRKQQEN